MLLNMAAVGSKQIESLALKLNSESPLKIKKALMALTKLTKNRENVRCFRLQGGLNRLLQLIRQTNKTMLDMALSALANCLLEEGSRLEVRRSDGIIALVDVLKRIQETSILNRTARALANLAENDLNTVVMEELGVIPELVKLLITTSDTNCHQSVLRALRGICTTPKRKSTVVDLDGFKTIVELLKTDKSNCCVRTVAEFTKSCSKEIAQQAQEYGGIKAIVTLANSDNPQLRNPALLSLANLAYHSHVRVCIGSEGGIQALSSQVRRGDPVHVTTKAIEGICFCCREAINRARVHECGALELLLKTFISGKPLHLEKKIVTAFTCFYYSDPSLEILVNGGLVPALVNHLGKIVSHASLLEEVDDDLSDQLSFSSDFSLDSPRAGTVKSSPFELKDANGEDIPEEKLFQKLEDTARKVSDTQASGRLTNFKKRMKLKPSPILTSPPPGVRTIGLSQSVFSMAGSETDTTSLVSVCTPSCSISTLASSRSCNNIATPSFSCSLPPSSSSSSPPSSSSSPSSQYCALGMSSNSQKADQNGLKGISAMMVKDKVSHFPATDHKTQPGNCEKGNPMILTPISTETSKSFQLSSPLSPKVGEEVQQHHSTGYSVLLLLSRISQMTDPSSLLVTKPCIQALLNYIAKVHNASPKCARLLNRLAANLCCFKALIVNGAVVAFHHQLSSGYRERERHSATQGTVQESPDWGLLSERSREKRKEDISFNSADEGRNNFFCNQMLLPTENCWQELGKQLLDTLSSQAQTPFGKGVLENLLLKGCQEERQQCALALPILCRSEKLRLYFLVEKKALALLCELLTSTNQETLMVAVESLLVLAEDLQVIEPYSHSTGEAQALSTFEDSKVHMAGKQTCSDLENHNGELPADNTFQTSQPMAKRFKKDSTVLKPTLSKKQNLCSTRTVDASWCMYKGSNLQGCNVKFCMDSGELISAHRQIIASASDVFTAMLSGDFLEGTLPVVPIRDISFNVFETAVHFAYGCSLSSPCTAPRHESSEPLEKDTKSNFFLELLMFADKFLMAGLKAACECRLIHLINLVSVVQFCIAGVQLNAPKLCAYCLCYLLQVKIADLPRSFHLFKELFMSDEKEAIVEHLYQLLLSYLKG